MKLPVPFLRIMKNWMVYRLGYQPENAVYIHDSTHVYGYQWSHDYVSDHDGAWL